MKAQLRKIHPSFGSSFSIRKYDQEDSFMESVWHFHSEYELLYISGGSGTRHIMNHISDYEGGELLFLGPDIPHFAFTKTYESKHIKIAVQMKEDFLGNMFLTNPELGEIKKLFMRSKNGIAFKGIFRHKIGSELNRLAQEEPFDKLMGLLKVLQKLATTDQYESLNVKGFTMEVKTQDEGRINHIFEYVQTYFQENISLDDISSEVNLTPPAFCRFFKRMTHLTFTEFLNEYRIAHACKLLQQEDMLIVDIADNCGFQTLSHFNKKFLKITGLTPSHFKENKPVVKMLAAQIEL